METPTCIHESAQWLAGAKDELRHAFQYGKTPLVITCRFLEVYIGGFAVPASYVHAAAVITRIFLFTSGSAHITAQGREYDLVPGRCYLLPAGMPFDVTYQPSVIYTYHLHVYDESGQSLFDPQHGITELTDDTLQHLAVSAFITHDMPACEMLGFRILQRFIAPQLDDITLRHLRAERFRDLIVDIQHHPSAGMTIDQLAARVHMSRSALSKGFKRATGVTLKEFMQNSILHKAKELLTYSDMPVAAIADILQYPETSCFTHMFKRETGTTPLAYRKASRDY